MFARRVLSCMPEGDSGQLSGCYRVKKTKSLVIFGNTFSNSVCRYAIEDIKAVLSMFIENRKEKKNLIYLVAKCYLNNFLNLKMNFRETTIFPLNVCLVLKR